MNLDILILALSPISIFTFAIIEWLTFRTKNPIDLRVRMAISMEILSKSLGVFVSWMLLLKLVNFVSPFEIFSISRLNMPKPINFLMSILIIDFFHYVIHRLHHSIPMLWRLHRTHHSDKTVNSITSFIHHPFETVSAFFIGISMYVIFDIPVIAIFCHSIFMVVHSPFSHTTIHIPRHIEKILSYVIVTPNFHRAHHSQDMKEGNSNFGINLRESPSGNTLKEYLLNPFIHRQEKSSP